MLVKEAQGFRVFTTMVLSLGLYFWGPFYWHGLTLIPAWITNYTHYDVWDEIIYPFLNCSGATVEV